jgi:hypothetical protein
LAQSTNHFIRSHQHIRRDRQANLLCGPQVDDKFKVHRRFHGKIGWLGSFEDSINVPGSALAMRPRWVL